MLGIYLYRLLQGTSIIEILDRTPHTIVHENK